MKLFVRRTGGRIGLWGGLLAAALAKFSQSPHTENIRT